MAAFEKFDWDNLKVFLETARAGNIAGAARRLKLDQSTVSRRVAQLETILGSALFERQAGGLRPTRLGQRLRGHAERMESAVIAFQEEMKGGADAVGRVRLGTMEGIASLYLASRLVGLHRKHPHLAVELLTSPQTVYVARREADIFLSFFQPTGRGLVSRRVGCFRLNLYAGRGYLDEFGVPRSLEDLRRHVFVSYIEDLIQVDAVKWLDDVIADPQVSFRSNSMIAQSNAAASGAGIVLLPEFAAADRIDLVQVLPGEATTTRELWMNVHCDLQFAGRIQAVMRHLSTLFASDPAMQVAAAKAPPCSMALATTRVLPSAHPNLRLS